MIDKPVRRALLSVSDKTGIVDLAKNLKNRGWMIISTGGTQQALRKAQIRVKPIRSFTGVPEVMDGRVKTLHPKIAAGILARRNNAIDMQQLETVIRTGTIDLVVVNLYPFTATAARPNAAFDELIEQIDIGGPTLIRAAAKNFRDVLVVTSPSSYDEVIQQLDCTDGPTLAFRFGLAYGAMRYTSQFDDAVANELARWHVINSHFERLPAQMTID